MIFVLICTEGKVSEPAYLKALSSTLSGQAPRNISTNVEVLPIPLGGNHGHKKLISIADAVVERHSKNENSLLSLVTVEDTVEKWIIVDHDDMEKHGISVDELRRVAQEAGYTLIINKPKFEFFVLASLSDCAAAAAVDKSQYTAQINMHVKSLNEQDIQKGFTKDMLMPKYTKKRFPAEKLFSMMLANHPELIDAALALDVDPTADCYTEMPIIMRRIVNLYK